MSNSTLRLITGNAHRELAEDIAKCLQIDLSAAEVGKFSSGETKVVLQDSLRDLDVFIVQSTTNPNPNDNLMELLIMADAIKRSSAHRITAVIPCFGYARQDRKDKSRAPISAKLIANLISITGIDRVITLDLHAGQIQGFFDIPVDNLYGENLLIHYLEEKGFKTEDIVVVSPDAGGVKRAKVVADKLHAGLAILHKERKAANEVSDMILVGDVRGKIAVLVDDMADTCGTLVAAADTLKAEGARQIYAAVSHGVLSGPAIERINNSFIDEVVVTDSIPVKEKQLRCPKLKVISVAPMLAEAIRRTHNGESISSLFKEYVF